MKAIEVQNLTKNYGSFTAVNNISFSVQEGEFVSFLGINGAGKSTTIRILSTLLAPDNGSIQICGHPLPQANKIRRCIGIVWQGNILDDLLSVHENLLCRGILYGLSRTEAKSRGKELAKLFDLEAILHKKYRFLSGGQKRKCEIAAALMHTPKILFLDEPTAGLDPGARLEVWNTIKSMRKNTGMAVFLTTHYMEEAEDADRIIFLDHGRITAQGTPHMLKNQYAFCRLKLYAKTPQTVLQKLHGLPHSYTCKCITVQLNNTIDAIDILKSTQNDITGFEVVQASLDDVFLHASGGEKH